MNCHQARDLLSPYIDGELAAAERAGLEEHLQQCQECRGELAELRAVVEALATLPEEPLPEGFGEKLHARLVRKARLPWAAGLVRGRWPVLSGPRPSWARALAVACLVVFLVSSMTAVMGLGRGWWLPVAGGPAVPPPGGAGDGTRSGLWLSGGATPGGQGGILTGNEVASSDRTVGLSQVSGPAIAPDVRLSPGALSGSAPAGEMPAGQAALQGELELRVVNIDEAISSLRGLAERAGGYLQDSTVTSRDGKREAVVVLRVPGKALSGLMQEARGLGRVLGERVTTRRLTQDWVDVQARLRIMRAQEEALQAMLSGARNIDEVLRIQYELYRLQADIESLDARMKYLQEDMDMAALQVLLREAGVAAAVSPWRRAQAAFLGTVRTMERLGQEVMVYVAQAFPVLMLAGLAWLVYARFGQGRWRR